MQGDGGVGVSGAAAESGAAPEEPPTAKAHALAVGQRQASLASLEGMLPSNAEEVDEDDIIVSRKSGIGDTYGSEG